MHLRLIVLVAALAAALAVPVAAQADVAMMSLPRDTHISA